MGTLLLILHKNVKVLVLAGFFVLSIGIQVVASDDPKTGDDGGDGEDTDFARSAIVKIQI